MQDQSEVGSRWIRTSSQQHVTTPVRVGAAIQVRIEPIYSQAGSRAEAQEISGAADIAVLDFPHVAKRVPRARIIKVCKRGFEHT